ncbi:MAG: YhdH/YhfP family quinone oxidoreductase [Proteobacteria bacterium]|nr:YhdH/YhfP family quinone oxidoreductase [Pseudomonadota bacterium]MBU1640646.1 YhdH/YhfP family quinone oxidoreductase [Pseudomonadota bacterium]
MSNTPFKALVVRQENDSFVRHIETRHIDELPAGEVLVRVHYSSLNYKDALSAMGNRGVTRKYPHTPGIDAAGVVETSSAPHIRPGQEVIVSCYDLGMNTAGGFADYIRVPAAWVVEKPEGLTLKEAMIYGTAGFTAALSVYKLMNQGVRPGDGPILVTGATGGVGSMAVAILSKEGFHVTAASAKAATDFLTSLGAEEIISREQVSGGGDKALLRPRWAGVIDTVGGEILAKALKTTKPCGAVTCCGNVASGDLPVTVYPFILRGVTLVGIDAAECPLALRTEIWQKIATTWKVAHLENMAREISFAEVSDAIDQMLAGTTKGRTIIKIL